MGQTMRSVVLRGPGPAEAPNLTQVQYPGFLAPE
jgi:hypothetical protein